MCGKVHVWLSTARVFPMIAVVVVQHYFCKVLVTLGAEVFLWSGASDPLWLSLMLNPEGQWRARHMI